MIYFTLFSTSAAFRLIRKQSGDALFREFKVALKLVTDGGGLKPSEPLFSSVLSRTDARLAPPPPANVGVSAFL